jgi:hypothetical protein
MDTHDSDLKEIGREAGINADTATSLSVASWAYSNAIGSGGQAWIKSRVYEPIYTGYLADWNNSKTGRVN